MKFDENKKNKSRVLGVNLRGYPLRLTFRYLFHLFNKIGHKTPKGETILLGNLHTYHFPSQNRKYVKIVQNGFPSPREPRRT